MAEYEPTETEARVQAEITEIEYWPTVIPAMVQARNEMFFKWEGILIEHGLDNDPAHEAFLHEVCQTVTNEGFSDWQCSGEDDDG